VKIHGWIAACTLAGGMYCGSALSQSQLGVALEAAWQRSVQAKTTRGELNRARAGQVAAQSLWAAPPALELSHRGEPFSNTEGQRESEVGLVWPLLLPGQRAARGAAARAEVDTVTASERAAKLRLAGEVREAAWTLLARRADVELAEAQARALQALANDVARRVASGDLARTDLLAAQAEEAAGVAAATEARQRARASAIRWQGLTGLEPPLDLAYEPAAMHADHPELEVAGLAAEGARRRLELMRAERREPPEVVVRYRHEVAAAGFPSENTIGLGVRIPFGAADRNLPREAAALAVLEVAQAKDRRLREQLSADAATARAGIIAAEEQLDAERRRAALLRERAGLLEKSFRAGETALAELLRTLAAAAQAEGSAARQRAELGLARSRLNQALGVLP
jgi:outer membrane protein TolC